MSFFSWFPFTFPTLYFPTLSIPASIQRRFISFLLQRTLGHLVKPGQLDSKQIDAQIGSGWIEIRDVELDDQAVNALISGLPLRLQGGSIGKVTAQIPWPNLFTSSFTLALSSLDLTFVLTPLPRVVPQPEVTDLSESVAAVAETFVHNELSSRENEFLRQSIVLSHPLQHVDEQGPSRFVPGSLDPFLHDEGEESDEEKELDLEGVSVLASAVERLLARFAFSATNTTIRIVHERESEFTLSVPEIVYETELPEPLEQDAYSPGSGAVRTLKIAGLALSLSDLAPKTPSTPYHASSSRSSSSSRSYPSSPPSEDEVPLAMSQSIASLPNASMYHSAVSSFIGPVEASRKGNKSIPTPMEEQPLEERILSFASEPVILRLVTPQPSPPSASGGGSADSSKNTDDVQDKAKISLTIQLGIIACALRSFHIRAVVDAVNLILPLPSTPSLPNPQSQTSHLSKGFSPGQFEAQLQLRSAVLLILQVLPSDDQLSSFFTRPLVPQIRNQHVRIHLDNVVVSSSSGQPPGGSPKSTSKASTSIQCISFAISDISIFSISRHYPLDSPETWMASPILIVDPNLASLYDLDSATRNPFPSIDLADWGRAESGQIRTSLWKVRPPQVSKRKPSAAPIGGVSLPSQPSAPAVLVRRESGLVDMIEIELLPVHVFVDLNIVAGLWPFVNAIISSNEDGLTDKGDISDDERQDEFEESLPSTPRAGFSGGRPMADTHRKNSDSATGIVSVRMLEVRLEVRSPPSPPKYDIPSRSGALVLDLHDIRITTGGKDPKIHQNQPLSAHFVEVEPPRQSATDRKVLAEIEISKIFCAFARAPAQKAATFLSIESTVPQTISQTFGTGFGDLPALPKICIRSNAKARIPTTSLECTIPSVQISIDKGVLDGLQLLADDAAQWAERTFAEPQRGSGTGRTPLIGSRFFIKGTKSISSLSAGSSLATRMETRPSEFAFSLDISEASVRLWIPRQTDQKVEFRPLDVWISGIYVLAEIKPEGKNESIVHLSLMNIKVTDLSANMEPTTLLSMTLPRSHTTASKPFLGLRLASVVISDTAAKESRVKLTLFGFTYSIVSDLSLFTDIAQFAKAPDGVFESVIPSERTVLSLSVIDGSVEAQPPKYPGAMVLCIGELDLSTALVGGAKDSSFHVAVGMATLLLINDMNTSTIRQSPNRGITAETSGVDFWKKAGYAQLLQLKEAGVRISLASKPDAKVDINGLKLKLQICADSIDALTAFFGACSSLTTRDEAKIPQHVKPTVSSIPSTRHRQKKDTFSNVDEYAFRRVPELGPSGDMIEDDLPTNLEYLDASFGAAAGLRDLSDDEFQDLEETDDYTNDLDEGRSTPTLSSGPGFATSVSGETIRMLDPRGIHIEENYFDTLPPQDANQAPNLEVVSTSIRIHDCEVNIQLHDGYDWLSTRQAIEDEVRAVRRRLERIRQLLAKGQVPDETVEEASATLFNSVYIGLPPNADDLEPGALMAAIDEELNEDVETASQSSWQSFRPPPPQRPASQPKPRVTRVHGRKLTRSKTPRVEFCFKGLSAEIDQLLPSEPLASRVLICVRNFEILDHIKTSTWRTFLTELKSDSSGNIRETGSNMVRAEFKLVRPVPGLPDEEARVRAKFLPLRLHVDQDALDFLKQFFSFKNPQAPPPSPPSNNEIFFQYAEVFPVEIKLDYKPKRVDYRALREGRTIELMNFFHFDGAEMTLRHITLSGITGWPKLFDLLNDLWTPDVKANQLADVISGISPIRSLVNVGSGVADLVLLPIAQYKKDGRLVRGVQKGATSFVKTTAMEAIKLGAKLATGTQVILEHAEHVLGPDFKDTVTLEALQSQTPPSPSRLMGFTSMSGSSHSSDEDSDSGDPISKYAEQPADVTEGIQSAYRSLSRNLNSAAQTILAVPMEVYERSGSEGPVRSVVRAVPIAVLKPMIGASEAVSKTLFGLSNTLDPSIRRQNEDKYKQR